jgi:CBS domain-containing protein
VEPLGGEEGRGVRVGEVMRRELVTVEPELPLHELQDLLLRERVSGVPVVEGGHVVGVVSRSDVVRQLEVERSQLATIAAFYFEPFDVETESERERMQVPEAVGARLEKLRVRDAMVRDVLSVSPEASVAEAARLMVERRVHRLLVLEGGRLVGLVSALDLAGLVANGRFGERGGA